jgi:hypothetical protein
MLISSFLSQRKFIVLVKGEMSEPREMHAAATVNYRPILSPERAPS